MRNNVFIFMQLVYFALVSKEKYFTSLWENFSIFKRIKNAFKNAFLNRFKNAFLNRFKNAFINRFKNAF
jgi:hypothetical protein